MQYIFFLLPVILFRLFIVVAFVVGLVRLISLRQGIFSTSAFYGLFGGLVIIPIFAWIGILCKWNWTFCPSINSAIWAVLLVSFLTSILASFLVKTLFQQRLVTGLLAGFFVESFVLLLGIISYGLMLIYYPVTLIFGESSSIIKLFGFLISPAFWPVGFLIDPIILSASLIGAILGIIVRFIFDKIKVLTIHPY